MKEHLLYSVRIALNSFYNKYLLGKDGPELLAAIHSIWDGDWMSARSHLQAKLVILNASAEDGFAGDHGGSNILSWKLKGYISSQVQR